MPENYVVPRLQRLPTLAWNSPYMPEIESQSKRIMLDVGLPPRRGRPGNVGRSFRDAQVGFLVSAPNEMQNQQCHGKGRKNMNQPTRHVKTNPAVNPSNH